MKYISEGEIRELVETVLAQQGGGADSLGPPVPVELSARHVHLTQEAVERLFGSGFQLTKARELSQPGEFLSGQRVKVVTAKGEIANVAVLGPVRKQVQVELSLTDARALGVRIPVNLSGDLRGAGDVLLVGPAGCLEARGAAIAARAHVHMTPADARTYRVADGDVVKVRLETGRPVTLEQVVVRVRDTFRLAVHVDFDEANAAGVAGETTGTILKGRTDR